MQLVLTSAEALLKGQTVVLKAETGTGYPAEIELLPDSALDGPPDLPDDVLATLGWDWKVLRWSDHRWTSTMRVPRREPHRSRRIEIIWSKLSRIYCGSLRSRLAAFTKGWPEHAGEWCSGAPFPCCRARR